MGYYETAQICENGHCISDALYLNPEAGRPFCNMCGAKTLTECPSCHSMIQGRFVDGEKLVETDYMVPDYCWWCGAPYPWANHNQSETSQKSNYNRKPHKRNSANGNNKKPKKLYENGVFWGAVGGIAAIGGIVVTLLIHFDVI